MAETGDLDDFFAKKDKRKKGKKKFATSNSIVETIEVKHLMRNLKMKQLGPKASQAPAPEPEKRETKIDIPSALTRDDEWREEEEKTQDLEGLKIQSLNLESEESTEKVPEPEADVGECEDEPVKANVSPWQNVGVPQQQETTQQQQPLDKEKRTVYVPPSLRNKQVRQSRNPPDLLSTQAFPSLSASCQQKQSPKPADKGFMEVRGTRGPRDATYDAPGLELTNKYSALDNN